MMNTYFFKCHMIKMITFVLCNIFEQIWYSEFILEREFLAAAQGAQQAAKLTCSK